MSLSNPLFSSLKISLFVFTSFLLVSILTAHPPFAFPAPQTTASLTPTYLNDMPSVDRVKHEIQGRDPTDTLARQVAVFNMLPEIIQRHMLVDRHRYNLTPDEQRLPANTTSPPMNSNRATRKRTLPMKPRPSSAFTANTK